MSGLVLFVLGIRYIARVEILVPGTPSVEHSVCARSNP